MDRKVIDSYYMYLDDFEELVVFGKSVKEMLESWEDALSIEERVCPNLVRVFYSNMELSPSRLDRILINIGGVSIEFNVGDLT